MSNDSRLPTISVRCFAGKTSFDSSLQCFVWGNFLMAENTILMKEKYGK
jgi:hypothetical protein